MELREYLFSQKIKINDFAEKVDINRTYLSAIINKKVIPSKRLAKDIEKATKGKVKAIELLEDKPNS